MVASVRASSVRASSVRAVRAVRASSVGVVIHIKASIAIDNIVIGVMLKEDSDRLKVISLSQVLFQWKKDCFKLFTFLLRY